MNASARAQQESAKLSRVFDARELDAILKAIEDFDLTDSDAWDTLDSLSSRTEVEGLDASPEAIFKVINSNRFEAIGSVHVTLNYGDKNENFSMGESFPAHILGIIDERGLALIEAVDVDTSSFLD